MRYADVILSSSAQQTAVFEKAGNEPSFSFVSALNRCVHPCSQLASPFVMCPVQLDVALGVDY